jgi:hypothetical protein
MNDPDQLDAGALRVALDAIDTVFKFKAYTSGSLLVMLLGKWRDDLREVLGAEVLRPALRGQERHTFDALNPIEVDKLAGAISILHQERFTDTMDDPELAELLEQFEVALTDHKSTRAAAKATADAKAVLT